MEPSFTNLPANFKRSVIKTLDYKSRCRLRKCSKLDRNLVDSCSVFLETVTLEPRQGELIYFFIEELKNSNELLNDKGCDAKEVFQDFLLIFKNPKSKVKRLYINYYNEATHPEGVNDFIDALQAEIETTNPANMKLKIEQLWFDWGHLNENNYSKILKMFDSKTLKSIGTRRLPIRNLSIIDEVAETDQWKNLKRIAIQEKTKIPVKYFLHMNSFRISQDSLSAEDAWKCIQNYILKPLPLCSFFHIYCSIETPLAEILELFDVPVKGEPEDFYSTIYYKHVQYFQLASSDDHIFVLKIGSRQIKGAICRQQFLEEDFDKSY